MNPPCNIGVKCSIKHMLEGHSKQVLLLTRTEFGRQLGKKRLSEPV